jgi:hypothetical protein
MNYKMINFIKASRFVNTLFANFYDMKKITLWNDDTTGQEPKGHISNCIIK